MKFLAVALTYIGFQCPWNYDLHGVTLPASAKRGLVINLAKTFLYRIELIFLKKPMNNFYTQILFFLLLNPMVIIDLMWHSFSSFKPIFLTMTFNQCQQKLKAASAEKNDLLFPLPQSSVSSQILQVTVDLSTKKVLPLNCSTCMIICQCHLIILQ